MTNSRSEPRLVARCISCGCTDDEACIVRIPGQMLPTTCAWILVDRRKGEGLCSACATVEQRCFALLQSVDPLELQPLAGQPTSSAELALITGEPVRRIRRALRTLERRGLAVPDRFDGRTLAWFRAPQESLGQQRDG